MTQDCSFTISGIIPRHDQWNNKVTEVNASLACTCENDNILFTDHGRSIDPRKNFNNSKLHLKMKGSNELWDNFDRYLKGFSSWDSDVQSYSEIRHDKCIIGETPVVWDENLRSWGSFDNISFSECLSNLRQRNLNCLLLTHSNINSIRNKFDQLVLSIKNNIDKLMISETKIDNSFATMQFHIEGYCIYRLDQNGYGGGILVYVWEDIPSKLFPMQSSSIEGFFIELNLRCKSGF